MPQQTQTERLMLSAAAIKLDAAGNVPTRLPLLITFDHPNSNRGEFSVNIDDLNEIKEHFDSGIGFPTEDASTGLAIDFKHEWLDKAAGWIKGLEIVPDSTDPTKGTMYVNPVDWTPDGEEAVRSGRFKCISPMGAFGRKNGKLSMWENVNNLKEKLSNVLEGAGLTNAPYQREMSPIRADRSDDLHSANDNVIYVYDVEQKKEPSMNLNALRVKERDALSVAELDFLDEHKDELSGEERKKFKLEAAAPPPDNQLTEEDKTLLAAVKDGSKKVVDATVDTAGKERLDRLESTVNRYREKEVKDILDKHVKRGAIKQDQAAVDGFWGKQLLAASSEEERKGLEDALTAIPSNEQLAAEIGTAEDVNAGSNAREQLDSFAKKKVEAAAKEGKTLLYADALKEVYRENKDLRTQDSQENKAKAGV